MKRFLIGLVFLLVGMFAFANPFIGKWNIETDLFGFEDTTYAEWHFNQKQVTSITEEGEEIVMNYSIDKRHNLFLLEFFLNIP